jgi:hypothetical protein
MRENPLAVNHGILIIMVIIPESIFEAFLLTTQICCASRKCLDK